MHAWAVHVLCGAETKADIAAAVAAVAAVAAAAAAAAGVGQTQIVHLLLRISIARVATHTSLRCSSLAIGTSALLQYNVGKTTSPPQDLSNKARLSCNPCSAGAA